MMRRRLPILHFSHTPDAIDAITPLMRYYAIRACHRHHI